MGHETTQQPLIQLMLEQTAEHGFQPFHVKKPSMGYLYNRSEANQISDMTLRAWRLTVIRIWAAIKREALLTASDGAGTPAEIDAIFKAVLNTPKGPFEQMDVVGLDVVYDIEQHYADARPGEVPTAPREYLQNYLDAGNLGVKSGKGFFEYQNKEG